MLNQSNELREKISKRVKKMGSNLMVQPWELGKKMLQQFFLAFTIAKVRYDGITSAKNFVKNLLFLVVYQRCNDALNNPDNNNVNWLGYAK